jgi:hypothetical protein
MSRKDLRKLTINDRLFLWRLTHDHDPGDIPLTCVETVLVYLDGFVNSPLKVSFPTTDEWIVGDGPGGVVWSKRSDGYVEFNLNRPAVIRVLIEHFFQGAWHPMVKQVPFFSSNGFEVLLKARTRLKQGNSASSRALST